VATIHEALRSHVGTELTSGAIDEVHDGSSDASPSGRFILVWKLMSSMDVVESGGHRNGRRLHASSIAPHSLILDVPMAHMVCNIL
jgi:hypothetical protein